MKDWPPHGQCRIRNNFVVAWAPWDDIVNYIVIKKLTVLLCRLESSLPFLPALGKDCHSGTKKYVTRDGVKRLLESNKRKDRFNKRGRFDSCLHSNMKSSSLASVKNKEGAWKPTADSSKKPLRQILRTWKTGNGPFLTIRVLKAVQPPNGI